MYIYIYIYTFHDLVDPLVIGRINYHKPSIEKVFVISCAYEIYHALKISLRDTVLEAIELQCFREVCRALN